MSVILNTELTCFAELKTLDGAKVVEALTDGRSLKSFSSLKIGIVNLMPTKEATERQWSKLMMQSDHWIEPLWIQMGSYQPKNTCENYLQKCYTNSAEVDWQQVDGLIITGAPVELMAFEAVDYWFELNELIDHATAAHVPILAVCWGAQALLYKRYGIQKQTLAEKCFGVFDHTYANSHPMTSRLQDSLFLPHSRHTGWDSEQLAWHSEVSVVIASEQAGVFALEDSEGDWYWSGHPEYEVETLLLEYERDVAKGIPQAPPAGYTQINGKWQINQHWQGTAVQLFSNWIELLAPKTELLRHQV